jgi:DNA anti-recombination protein RmuC
MLPDIHKRPERTAYDKILYDQHVQRVKCALPTIDNSTPRKHPLNNRRKQEQSRYCKKIERENMHILENIAISIQKSSIDNTLSRHVEETRRFKKHLSRIKRRIEMAKIMAENIDLLKRIQDA